MADSNQSPTAGEQPASQDSSNKAAGADQEAGQADTDAKNMVEIDGEKVSLDQIKEWKKGHMMEADYRRKTQELAEAKREIARSKTSVQDTKAEDLSPEVKQAMDVLKKAGFATKDDLKMMKIQEEDQKAFRKLIKSNPELKPHEKALKQIGLTDNRAWEDIAKDYGFLKDSKLEKAKATRPITGTRSSPGANAPKLDIAKMSPKEYEAWKRQNLGQGKWA
jgi:hypothetical protein